MEKYETPIMEMINFERNIDTIVESVIDKDDENNPFVGPGF